MANVGSRNASPHDWTLGLGQAKPVRMQSWCPRPAVLIQPCQSQACRPDPSLSIPGLPSRSKPVGIPGLSSRSKPVGIPGLSSRSKPVGIPGLSSRSESITQSTPSPGIPILDQEPTPRVQTGFCQSWWCWFAILLSKLDPFPILLDLQSMSKEIWMQDQSPRSESDISTNPYAHRA